MSSYVICYDISDHKRLAKLARALEKVAIRVQYSIFLVLLDKGSELNSAIEIIEKNIKEIDDVRIYRVKSSFAEIGFATDLDNPFDI